MFKNRAIQVSLTKPGSTAGTPVEVDKDAVLYYNQLFVKNVEQAARGFVMVYAACKAIDTASKILIKITPAA